MVFLFFWKGGEGVVTFFTVFRDRIAGQSETKTTRIQSPPFVFRQLRESQSTRTIDVPEKSFSIKFRATFSHRCQLRCCTLHAPFGTNKRNNNQTLFVIVVSTRDFNNTSPIVRRYLARRKRARTRTRKYVTFAYYFFFSHSLFRRRVSPSLRHDSGHQAPFVVPVAQQ